ncbi:NUDIX domain-containing protein [uncultured Kushneria sp.]|uniref:NUDIX hydrolase n=1 Tax=uncultured Kushneria sp. TaxID=905033 RepID=UPI002610F85D|nr:NUDIX domain-containing protein [uncultured Kushneria sp.]
MIHIAAAVLINERQQMLVVRKRGTSTFMQPGGKIDNGERSQDALVRELREELGLVIDPNDAFFLGNYKAPAANEPGFTVNCDLYRVETKPEDVATPAAEIDEIAWISASDSCGLELAPLTHDLVLPLLEQRYMSQ